MKAANRLALLEDVGAELQRRYTFRDVDLFLEAHGVSTAGFDYGNSKRLYTKDVLKSVSEPVLMRIAGELGLIAVSSNLMDVPANWRDTTQFRLFISHISEDKDKATKLKSALTHHAIAGFVAHEDILPTLDWQEEIQRALNTMDGFVSVHTPGFDKSIWTQQEIGFALGRGAKIICFEMGELPTGFLAKHQALKRRRRTATEIAAEISWVLAEDPRTADKLKSAQDALRQHHP